MGSKAMGNEDTGRPLRVLIVDDEPDISGWIKMRLTREAPHIAIESLTGGPECLEYLEENHADCILSDYQMPGMNGLELLGKLREDGDDTPFIFITGQGNEEVAREAFKAGAFDYFTKEVGFAHFTRIINSIEQAVRQRRIELEKFRAEEAISTSEARYRELFDGINAGVAVYEAVDDGRDFIFRDFNRGAERIEKIKKEELIGRPVTEVFPGVKDFGLLDVFRRVWRTGEPESHPIALYRDNRVSGWKENYVYKLPSGEVVAVYEDVTERQRVYEKLRKSEEKYRDLFENAIDPIFIVDSHLNYIDANKKASELTGYTRDELLHMKILDLVPPELVPRSQAELDKLKAAGSYEKFTGRIIRKDGTQVDVEVSSSAIMDGETVIGSRDIVRDITRRVKAEQELMGSRERFRALFEYAADPIFVHDLEGRVVDVNRAACDYMGYGRDELIGMSITDLEKGLTVEILRGLWDRVSDGRPETVECEAKRKDGSTFPVQVRVGMLKLKGETLAIAIVRDMTGCGRTEN